MEVEYENGEKLEDEEIIEKLEDEKLEHPERLHKAKVRGCKFLLPCIWDAANSSILQYLNFFFLFKLN
jgi:hypothetical protein